MKLTMQIKSSNGQLIDIKAIFTQTKDGTNCQLYDGKTKLGEIVFTWYDLKSISDETSKSPKSERYTGVKAALIEIMLRKNSGQLYECTDQSGSHIMRQPLRVPTEFMARNNARFLYEMGFRFEKTLDGKERTVSGLFYALYLNCVGPFYKDSKNAEHFFYAHEKAKDSKEFLETLKIHPFFVHAKKIATLRRDYQHLTCLPAAEWEKISVAKDIDQMSVQEVLKLAPLEEDLNDQMQFVLNWKSGQFCYNYQPEGFPMSLEGSQLLKTLENFKIQENDDIEFRSAWSKVKEGEGLEFTIMQKTLTENSKQIMEFRVIKEQPQEKPMLNQYNQEKTKKEDSTEEKKQAREQSSSMQY